MPKILAFAGSARQDSFNKKLIKIAAAGATTAGGDVKLIDLRDYPLPLMDEDVEKEQGLSENVKKLKALFIEADGLLISCPEYNSSITPMLKNTIDWVSRPAPNETSLQGFRGKFASLMSASPGSLGGLRGLVTVRSILGNIGVTVLPDQVAVSAAHEAFNPDGSLKYSKQQESIIKLGAGLVELLKKLKA